MSAVKLLSIVGARPQFVKAAVIAQVIKRLRLPAGRRPRHRLVHTGQHFDQAMSAVFFRDLPLPKPAYRLGVGGLPPTVQLGRMIERLNGVLERERPDAVIVYGDTTSTLAGAVASSVRHVPVAHVEAGLRSFNRRMPEETNRVLTDHASRWLFCPSANAAKQLAKEGLTRGVHVVGDVMVDALRQSLPRVKAARRRVLSRWGLTRGEYYLATVHRAENTQEAGPILDLFKTFNRLALPVVLPLHPRTRRLLERAGWQAHSSGSLRIVPPVPYHEMLVLEQQACAILTDSGGVQKEAYFWGVPCLTLRQETEWVETVDSGWNQLVGLKPSLVRSAVASLTGRSQKPRRALYGRGHAGEAVVRQLMKDLGVSRAFAL